MCLVEQLDLIMLDFRNSKYPFCSIRPKQNVYGRTLSWRSLVASNVSLTLTTFQQNSLFRIWLSGDRASWLIRKIKPTNALVAQICFWNKILHVSDSSYVHHQEFFTVHTAMVCVIQVCWQLASSQGVSKTVWHISLLCIQW